MKLIQNFFFILMIFSWYMMNAHACQLSIPESYFPIFSNPPVSGHYEKCEKEPCHCVDKVNPWYAELIDNEVIDYVAWRQVESCINELDCDEKFSYLKCTEGTEIKNYEQFSVYCAVNIMKIQGKKLVESAEKKAAYETSQLVKISAENEKEIEIKTLSSDLEKIGPLDINTNAKRDAVMLKILKRLKSIGK